MEIKNVLSKLIAMNRISLLLLTAACATGPLLRAQEMPPPGGKIPVASPKPSSSGSAALPVAPDAGWPRFDINFRGGTPSDLVNQITNQTGRPLNVIIPPEHASTELPQLKMSGVTAPQLFEAIAKASQRTVPVITGWANLGGGRQPQVHYESASYGFRNSGSGPLTPDTVWYFYVEQPVALPELPELPKPQPAMTCRFYQLGPYLDQGQYKVEDITTALDTAWKMLGEGNLPQLKFHKETRLLIAVGQMDRLTLIDQLLSQLSSTGLIDPATGLPVQGVPAESNKTKPGSTDPAKPKPGQR
jgi:hypothetical protein